MTSSSINQGEGASRRDFLKAGAFSAAPLVALGAPAAALAADGQSARLARLEAEHTLATMHRNWLRSLAQGRLGSLSANTDIQALHIDALASPPEIALAEDRQTATCRHVCIVTRQAYAEEECTLAHMARLQGHALETQELPAMLEASYRRAAHGEWRLVRAALR